MAEVQAATGTVLIVDDDASNLKLLDMVLSREFDTLVADSGERALKMLAEHSVDLVLLDLLMPDMDGIAVCRAVKADPQLAGIPIIFITGMNDPVNEEVGLEAGAVDYITKPIKPQIVCTRVRLHLQNALHIQFLERLLDATNHSLERTRAEARTLLQMSGLVDP